MPRRLICCVAAIVSAGLLIGCSGDSDRSATTRDTTRHHDATPTLSRHDIARLTVGLAVKGCRAGGEFGSGVLIGGALVATSAHVVAGATEITVTHGFGGRGNDHGALTRYAGSVVAFDPEMDLAYIALDRVAQLGTTRLPTTATSKVTRGAVGTMAVVRDGTLVVEPVQVTRPVEITTEDIYREGETIRPGYELAAEVSTGDSGGAVFVDGRLVAIIWARSNQVDDRAYAIDLHRAGALVRQQHHTGVLGTDLDLTRCER